MTAPGESRTSKFLHDSYLVGLGVQAAIGSSQLLAAVALYLGDRMGWLRHLAHATDPALFSHAHHGLRVSMLSAVHDFAAHKHGFWLLYLFAHGLLNLSVVVALLAKKTWAHPASMVVLTGFVAYQMDRFRFSHAPSLLVLSLFDVIVIGLVWREWQQVKAQRAA